MMQEFLKTYKQAISLDDICYDCHFPTGVGRSDFILFKNQVVCEVKEIQNIKIPHQVEKLSRKENLSEQNLKRDLYNSINKALSKANGQIKETKDALSLPNALGLVILENLMQDDLSVLSLMDAADRKMLGGLVHIDCVLCLDMVNTFSDSKGKLVRPAQIVVRDTERAKKLCEFINQFLRDFCKQLSTPFFDGFQIEQGDQIWFTDIDGKYTTYKAKLDFKSPIAEAKNDWRKQLSQFIDKWWWVIPLPAILYDW